MSELETRPSSVVEARTAADVQDMFAELDKSDKTDKSEDREDKGDKDDKTPKEEKEIDLVEDEEEVEVLDLKEDKEKEDVEGDEEDEEIKIETSPRKQQLLKDYPDIFKKYPWFEGMMYRDKQWNELFGTFDDAKELAEKAEVYESFESQLLEGKTEEILKNVKDTDSKAFDKIVDDYLPALHRVDKDAYFEIIGNIGKQMIMEMAKEAKSSGNEELQQAALTLNQFMFGTSTFTPAKTRVAKTAPTEEKNEVEKERLQFAQERFDTSRVELQSKVDNILRATISQYIDPKNSMSAYVKKNAINDALKDLTNSLGNDSILRKNLDNLWRNAFSSKFSKESLGKIQSVYLGTAKAKLASAIKKARTEALKDAAPRVKREVEDEENNSDETPRKRGNIAPGRTSQPNSKDEMKKGESVVDYFNRD